MTSSQRLITALLVVIFGLVVASCQGDALTDQRVSALPLPDAPPNLPPPPGYEVAECGWAVHVEAADCFLEALDSEEPATLYVRALTSEGDPSYEILRSTPTGEVERYFDSSAVYHSRESEPFRHQTCGGSNIVIHRGLVALGGGCQPTVEGW